MDGNGLMRLTDISFNERKGTKCFQEKEQEVRRWSSKVQRTRRCQGNPWMLLHFLVCFSSSSHSFGREYKTEVLEKCHSLNLSEDNLGITQRGCHCFHPWNVQMKFIFLFFCYSWQILPCHVLVKGGKLKLCVRLVLILQLARIESSYGCTNPAIGNGEPLKVALNSRIPEDIHLKKDLRFVALRSLPQALVLQPDPLPLTVLDPKQWNHDLRCKMAEYGIHQKRGRPFQETRIYDPCPRHKRWLRGHRGYLVHR